MSSSEETSAANFFRALLTGGLLRNKTIGVDRRTVNNHHIASMGMNSQQKKGKTPPRCEMVAWQWYKYQRNGNTIRIINKINGQQGNWREAGVKR